MVHLLLSLAEKIITNLKYTLKGVAFDVFMNNAGQYILTKFVIWEILKLLHDFIPYFNFKLKTSYEGI